MELLVRAVLLGAAQADAFGNDPQPHPPDIQPRQATQPGARKRAPIVTPNAHGQPELGKAPLEAAARQRIAATEQRVAAQHIPTEAIAQRQRIAIAVIARAELAFEVGRPVSFGPVMGASAWPPCGTGRAADAARPAVAAQQITHRRSTRPGGRGLRRRTSARSFFAPQRG